MRHKHARYIPSRARAVVHLWAVSRTMTLPLLQLPHTRLPHHLQEMANEV